MLTKFDAKLGMVEMEVAAEIIMDRLKEFPAYSFTLRDFTGTNAKRGDKSVNGFLELLYYGWLTNDGCLYKGEFKPKRELFVRLGLPEPSGDYYDVAKRLGVG